MFKLLNSNHSFKENIFNNPNTTKEKKLKKKPVKP